MSRNIAILIFGEARYLESSSRFWSFLDLHKNHNVKVFVSTWVEDSSLNLNVSEEDYKKILGEIPHQLCIKPIQTFIDYFYNEIQKDVPQHLKVNTPPGVNFIIYHLKNGIELIKKSDFIPDDLLVVRSDCLYGENFNKIFSNKLKKDTIYFNGIGDMGDGNLKTDDMFVFGDYSTLETWINNTEQKIGAETTHIQWLVDCKKNGFSAEEVQSLGHGALGVQLVRKTAHKTILNKNAYHWDDLSDEDKDIFMEKKDIER